MPMTDVPGLFAAITAPDHVLPGRASHDDPVSGHPEGRTW
jgi:hypothetical protein